ncbi:hypothetical protein ABZT04_37420 [Streptomyces sp. NPDC005492]|uniref:hypothetical protein n=1 Tax=Streptomyces sp. NPDC005492 TaxID=3156883 RepID=UPI0033A535D4
MSLTELTGTSRVTVFPLEALTLAYTTQSSDQRGLGDIGLVAVVDVLSEGEELWRLARDLSGRTNGTDQARWILTQANRARVVAAYTDLPRATWTAYIRRRIDLDSLFANHDILLTGRIELPGFRGTGLLHTAIDTFGPSSSAAQQTGETP